MARYVIYGAGAIGGTVGAVLSEAGHDVLLIARGSHYERLAADGLDFETAAGRRVLRIPVAASPAEAVLRGDDIVLLCMKSQDTETAIGALAANAPSEIALVCLQNGTANEPVALRRFEHVFGGFVYSPAFHLAPGIVRAYGSPTIGIFDLGRYPVGEDPTAEAISADFRHAGLSSAAHDDIVRWKYAKLLNNLNNVLDVVFTSRDDRSVVAQGLQREGRQVLRTAGVEWAELEELGGRELPRASPQMLGEQPYFNSTWQSVTRNSGGIETDYLNGEIVRLARLYGVDAPLNAAMQRLSREVLAHGRPFGGLDEAEFLASL